MTFDEILNQVLSKKIQFVTTDSRNSVAGSVFVAVKGTMADGHNYIEQAIALGAKYIIAERFMPELQKKYPQSVFIQVNNSSKASALLAQAQESNPAKKLVNLAVTGTNGKTTVAYLVRSIINNSGQKCGLMGTVIYDTTQEIMGASLTTPDVFTIADITRKIANAGAKFMVAEASSHAMDQDRLEGIGFRAAAFTNLTGDHLDYHKSKQAYLSAKMKLFEKLSIGAKAILNKQSPEAQEIAQRTKAGILWFAVDEPADITAHINSMTISGTDFLLEYAGRKKNVRTSLTGKYNISNCLAAAGLCLAAGFELSQISNGIEILKEIPGRLQRINNKDEFTVLVDYAHTDDALKNVLETIKPLCQRRLIAVFGCGGERDRTKRPRMAKAAHKYADIIIVTSDNPRTENPNSIIDEIMTGFDGDYNKSIIVEPDRKKAIALSIREACKGDTILIAGKGHENYQILADRTIHFSDEETARQFLIERENEEILDTKTC